MFFESLRTREGEIAGLTVVLEFLGRAGAGCFVAVTLECRGAGETLRVGGVF